MKKISSLLLTILCFPYVLTGCDSSNGVKDEKIDFFSTTEFTIDSFISAVKEYGTESDGYYGLSNAQSVACYSNDSIKRLLTSANYGVMSNEKINANTLWKVMYEDIFSKNVTFTLDSFLIQLTINVFGFQLMFLVCTLLEVLKIIWQTMTLLSRYVRMMVMEFIRNLQVGMQVGMNYMIWI